MVGGGHAGIVDVDVEVDAAAARAAAFNLGQTRFNWETEQLTLLKCVKAAVEAKARTDVPMSPAPLHASDLHHEDEAIESARKYESAECGLDRASHASGYARSLLFFYSTAMGARPPNICSFRQ